jgi:toxin ParE1/3/4
MPPKYTIRLLPAAEADFTEIIAYIALDNPSAAGTLAGLIEKKLAGLQRVPFRGKIPDEENLSRMGYRYLVVGNYLIFYTVEQHSVWIHRIIHGARDYLSLF